MSGYALYRLKIIPNSNTGLARVSVIRDDIDEALLVTTGQSTQKARDEASVSSYELMEGQELTSFIRRNDLEQIVEQYVETSN